MADDAEDGKEPRVRKTWRGCLVILGGFLIHLTLGTLYTFGNVTTYLTSYIRDKVDPNFTYEQATWIYTGNMMAQGMFMMLGGYLEWKIGPRPTAFIGCTAATTGVLTTWFSINISPWFVVFTYGVLFGLGTGIGYVVPLACGMRWFPERKGLVIGIILGGFGLGSFIFTQVQTAFLNPNNISVDLETGYFTEQEILEKVPMLFLLLGGTYAAIQIVGCLLLGNPPKRTKSQLYKAIEKANREFDEEMKSTEAIPPESGKVAVSSDVALSEPTSPTLSGITQSRKRTTFNLPEEESLKKKKDDDDEDEPFHPAVMRLSRSICIEAGDTSMNPSEAVRTREFFMLWFTFLFNQQAIGYISTMYKAYGQTFITDDRFLARIGAVASVFNSLGRIVWGAIGDRTCYRTTMMIVTSLLTVFFVTFAWSKEGGQVMYAVWVIGIFSTFCGNFALLPTATCQTFGPTFAGTNYGLVFTSAVLSQPLQSFLGEQLTKLIGPTGVLFVTAGFTLISFGITFFYNKNPNPDNIRRRQNESL